MCIDTHIWWDLAGWGVTIRSDILRRIISCVIFPAGPQEVWLRPSHVDHEWPVLNWYLFELTSIYIYNYMLQTIHILCGAARINCSRGWWDMSQRMGKAYWYQWCTYFPKFNEQVFLFILSNFVNILVNCGRLFPCLNLCLCLLNHVLNLKLTGVLRKCVRLSLYTSTELLLCWCLWWSISMKVYNKKGIAVFN